MVVSAILEVILFPEVSGCAEGANASAPHALMLDYYVAPVPINEHRGK